MSNLVKINNTELGIKEFNGQRVITFKDIDRVHNRPDGTARNAFNRNRKRLIKNEDYFIITPTTLENTELHTKRSIEMGQNIAIGISQISPRGTTFVTESGLSLIHIFCICQLRSLCMQFSKLVILTFIIAVCIMFFYVIIRYFFHLFKRKIL